MSESKQNFNFENEKPLQRLVGGYSSTAIFRTIAFIGDSLSSGEFETFTAEGKKEYHDLFQYSWGQYIARRNGIKAYNFSRGGMTAKWYMETFADEMNYFDKDLAAQAYVIALGVNDIFGEKMEIGSMADVDREDWHKNADTFAGYYAQIIAKYKEISPDAKFFLVTLPKDVTREGYEEPAKKMRSFLYDFAKHFSNTYVIDLLEYGDEYDPDFRHNYFLSGHLNPMGYIYTAEIIDSYIDYIVRHNPDDFRYSGLINSGIKFVK